MERSDENITHDERRVSELIGTLRHVEAPSDFEAKVRSRIATQGERRRTFAWTPVLASAAALVVIAVGLYFGLRSTRTNAPTSDVAVSNSVAPAAANAAVPAAPQVVATTTQSPEIVASTKPGAGVPPTQSNRSAGGSVDEALTEGRKVFPHGVDPRNTNTSDTRGVGGNAQVPIGMIFSGLGIGASWNGSGWQVNSVMNGSLPERSGLRTGDVIESIDGKALGERTVIAGTFNARSLSVRRDGKAVEIPFKP